jgi:chorismate lyase/3-hydroxybenzoate synthase
MPEFRRRTPALGASPFYVNYLPFDRAGELSNDPHHLLASIRYTADDTDSMPGQITVPMKPLGKVLIEVWRSWTPVECGHNDGISFSRNEDVLFGHLYLSEHDYESLDAATFTAYRRLYACALDQGFPHPLRIWNFLSDINGRETHLERYQAFCQGRHRALERLATQPRQLPAASAIGTRGGDLRIYFLAAREPGNQVENPRQISAFHYPPHYSPKSPVFSRAVIKRWNAATHLYISGTASIVGYKSRHAADTLAQLDETLNNLEALVSHAGCLYPLSIRSVNELSLLKLYVRMAGDHEAIVERLNERLDTAPPTLLLQGDLCRSDLCLEIEGLYTEQATAN